MRTLTVVIVPVGPVRLAVHALADRFADIRTETSTVLVRLPAHSKAGPQDVLDYCAARGVGVAASCVVSRSVCNPGAQRAELVTS